jgi:hypothetical protein
MTKTQEFSYWDLVIDYYLGFGIWLLEFKK